MTLLPANNISSVQIQFLCTRCWLCG